MGAELRFGNLRSLGRRFGGRDPCGRCGCNYGCANSAQPHVDATHNRNALSGSTRIPQRTSATRRRQLHDGSSQPLQSCIGASLRVSEWRRNLFKTPHGQNIPGVVRDLNKISPYPRVGFGSSRASAASLAAGGRAGVVRNRRRSRTKTPGNPITPTKAPHTPKTRNTHSALRAAAARA